MPPSDADLDEQEQEQDDNGELAGVQEESDDTQDEKNEGERHLRAQLHQKPARARKSVNALGKNRWL